MENNDDLDFLKNSDDKNLFDEIEKEKEKDKKDDEINSDEFVKNLPDWDLPPLFEKVRRVNRQ